LGLSSGGFPNPSSFEAPDERTAGVLRVLRMLQVAVLTDDGMLELGVLVLPSKLSRHNCLAAPHALAAQLGDAVGSKGDADVLIAPESKEQVSE
jgi:hypothetical protein